MKHADKVNLFVAFFSPENTCLIKFSWQVKLSNEPKFPIFNENKKNVQIVFLA